MTLIILLVEIEDGIATLEKELTIFPNVKYKYTI
jgi:hypothetical protein